jgi:hypothetical protein
VGPSDSEVWPPPVQPSSLPGPHYPATAELLHRQVDMQIADLRVLLRLPLPELDPDAGLNFTAAAMMLNLSWDIPDALHARARVSGMSVEKGPWASHSFSTLSAW